MNSATEIKTGGINARIFRFDLDPEIIRKAGVWGRTVPAIERLFALDRLDAIYSRAFSPKDQDCSGFVKRALDDLEITWSVGDGDIDRIPRSGPLVVVANHPFGAPEGLLLMQILRTVRPDVKIMANSILRRVPELHESMIFVDPYGGKESVRQNCAAMRQAMRTVEAGGALAVFPAGDVAHFDPRQRAVLEQEWSGTVARIARRTGASVLPVYFEGRNSLLFQLAGLLHPRLRSALLPRELLAKRNRCVTVRIGSTIPARKFPDLEDDAALAAYFRERTLMLRHRPARPSPGSVQGGLTDEATRQPSADSLPPIPETVPWQCIATEIDNLPPDQKLVDADEFAVYFATEKQIPHALFEISRLREITYRAVGEGTGRALDRDEFDSWYTHLFLWDRTSKRIAGAYRLGATDQITARAGLGGLYTSTLFDYNPALLDRLGPALELGRSFIRVEYQKSYSPLLLLWKGIGQYVVCHPRYRTLFGPVSISGEYQHISRELMVQFLASHHDAPDLRQLARARHPFQTGGTKRPETSVISRFSRDSDEVAELISDIEPDNKGIPVLLRQYLKLGAKFFAYNVDAAFSNALDALMVVDLARTNPKLLERYMGREGVASFRSYHGLETPQGRKKEVVICN